MSCLFAKLVIFCCFYRQKSVFIRWTVLIPRFEIFATMRTEYPFFNNWIISLYSSFFYSTALIQPVSAHLTTIYFVSLVTQTKPKLQSCKLRVAPKIPSTACCRADFYEKRNPQPLVVYPFFLLCMCNPVGGFFFLFFIILYIIYKYIYIHNNIYTIYRYTSTRTDTKQKTHTHKSCGLRFGIKSIL